MTLFMDDRSFSLFESELDNDLIKCYFCLLVSRIDEIIDEENSRLDDQNSEINKLIDSLCKIVENYQEPLLEDSKNEMLFNKIIEFKAGLNKEWNLLLNNLKMMQ